MLIIETVIEMIEGAPVLVSILSAGAVKKCFDLGIPCYLHTAAADENSNSNMSAFEHLDKIECIDDGYEFTFGNTILNAATLDDRIGDYHGGGPA